MENIGYALIGTPDGLQVRTKGILENRSIGRFIDLPNRVINLIDAEDEILAVVREYDGHDLTTYFILYRYALEIDRNRTGAFHGSVVALKNCKASGAIIYIMLTELASQVAAKIVPATNKFLEPLDEIQFMKPPNLTFLKGSIKPYGRFSPFNQNQGCFVYAPKAKFARIAFLEAALNEAPLTKYQKCFFSEFPSVANYVREQGGLDYFTEQKPTEEHLRSFGMSEKVDFQLNLKPRLMLLEELQTLKDENKKLRKAKQQLEQQAAEFEKKEKTTGKGISLQQKQTSDKAGKPHETEKQADIVVNESNQQSVNSPSDDRETQRGLSSHATQVTLETSSHSKRQRLSIRSFVRFIFALFALILISLIILLTVGKDIPYLSNLLPAPENRETSQEPPASSPAPAGSSNKQATKPVKVSSLSEEQERLWADIEAYLKEIESNLKYNLNEMNRYKNSMEEAGMQSSLQFQKFSKIYNNYAGSGLAFDELVKKSIRVEGRQLEIDMNALTSGEALSVTSLAAYLLERCPNIPSSFTTSDLENTIINANPNDVDPKTKTIINANEDIVFFIPKGATCDLN